jgi:hypothetical protein
MDLASKKVIIEKLKEIRDHYREDTDVGSYIREGVEKCMNYIEGAYPKQLFSLTHLGESDLNELLKRAQAKLDELTEEPKIEMFMIRGFYDYRYTKCHEKSKEILKEEFDLMLEHIQEDYADSKMDIQMKTIKQSNLKDYNVE